MHACHSDDAMITGSINTALSGLYIYTYPLAFHLEAQSMILQEKSFLYIGQLPF